MEQKTTLMRFLLFGISVIVMALPSCGKKIVEPNQTAIYVYVNKLGDSIRFEEYGDKQSSVEYLLMKGDSVTFLSSGDVVYPFSGSGNTPKAQKVILRFPNHQCTTYVLDNSTYSGEGVYNVKEYDNYSSDLINKNGYTLRYSIDSVDYKKSLKCN